MTVTTADVLPRAVLLRLIGLLVLVLAPHALRVPVWESALVAVAIGATVGAWGGFRESLLRYRAATLIATVGLLMSPIGLWLGARAPHDVLALLFAAVLVLSGVRQLWRLRSGSTALPESMQLPPLCPIHPDTGRFRWRPRRCRNHK